MRWSQAQRAQQREATEHLVERRAGGRVVHRRDKYFDDDAANSWRSGLADHFQVRESIFKFAGAAQASIRRYTCQYQSAHGRTPGPGHTRPIETGTACSPASRDKGNSMGDRGGKKDKKKNQQQLATKQKNKDLKRLDKAPSKPMAVNTRTE